MGKVLLVLCLVLCVFSCRDKVICPAFQSTYILDDSVREAYFSYVWALDKETRESYLASLNGGAGVSSYDSSIIYLADNSSDSSLTTTTANNQEINYYEYVSDKVVPWRNPKRTKYGIVKKTPSFIKSYRMRTAPMENVLTPPKPQVMDEVEMDTSMIATDSLAISDSTLVAVEPKDVVRYKYGFKPDDKFNVEQDYYIKYFGKYLIDNSPIKSDSVSLEDSGEEKEKKPFFKKIIDFFKFKKKQPTDSLEVDDVPMDEEDSDTGEGDDWFEEDDDE